MTPRTLAETRPETAGDETGAGTSSGPVEDQQEVVSGVTSVELVDMNKTWLVVAGKWQLLANGQVVS